MRKARFHIIAALDDKVNRLWIAERIEKVLQHALDTSEVFLREDGTGSVSAFKCEFKHDIWPDDTDW